MPPDELTLRPAEQADAEAVASIQLRARRGAAMPPGVHSDAEVLSWLSARLAEDEVWLAEVGGRPAGYARLTSSWLDDLYVAPPLARHGVGSALLDLAKSRRPEGFCLWVFEMNTPARSFYAARGLVELERTDGHANEERAPDVRMAWPGHDPLTFLRRLIDEVDGELADLVNRRVAITRAIQPHKGSPDRDPTRERQIAERMAARVPALGVDRWARIVHTVITESLDA